MTTEIAPPKVKEPVYVKSSGAVKESNYTEHRANFIPHFNKTIEKLDLPWNDEALDAKYGIGTSSELQELSRQTVKKSRVEYEEEIRYYKSIVNNLKKEKGIE